MTDPIPAALSLLRSWSGIIADPRAGDDGWTRYLDIIATGEAPDVAAQMAHASGCGLVLRGWLARILARPPACLLAPYHDGSALWALSHVAHAANAIRSPLAILPGSIVHVAAGSGGPEHVYAAVEVTPDPWGGLDVLGIEGGSRTANGSEQIRERRRVVSREDGAAAVWDAVDDNGPVRVVTEVYDLAAMLAFYGATTGEPDT